MEQLPGGVSSQNELLTKLENHLNRTAVSTASILGTNYNTYKEWKGGRRNMGGPTLKLVAIIFEIAGTKYGKIFGI